MRSLPKKKVIIDEIDDGYFVNIDGRITRFTGKGYFKNAWALIKFLAKFQFKCAREGYTCELIQIKYREEEF